MVNPEGDGKIEQGHLEWICGFHGPGYVYSLHIIGGKHTKYFLKMKKRYPLFLLCAIIFSGCSEIDFPLDSRALYRGYYTMQVHEKWSYWNGETRDTAYSTLGQITDADLAAPGKWVMIYWGKPMRESAELLAGGRLLGVEGSGRVSLTELEWNSSFHGSDIYTIHITGTRLP